MGKLGFERELGIALLALILMVAAFSALRINVQAQGEPTMKIVDPATGSTTINVGSPDQPFPPQGFPFTVNVILSVTTPIADFYAFQVAIRYNMTLVNCTIAWMDKTNPSFIFRGKNPIIVDPLIEIVGDASYVFWGASLLLAPISLPTGQYLLGQANFTAYKAEPSVLDLITADEVDPEYQDNSFLLDSFPHDIAFLTENCQITPAGAASPPLALFSFNPTANIAITPVGDRSPAGQRINSTLSIANASDVRSWTANVTYNNAVLAAKDVYEGSFLQSAGSTEFTFAIDQASGSAQLSCSLLDSGGANDTAKPLAIMTFEVIGYGESRVTVARADLRPLNINFDASASFDPDGTIQTYQWDFGDNTTAEGLKVAHAFNSTGIYPVTLTVFDNSGLNGSLTRTVSIGAAPFVSFTFSPAEPTNLDIVTLDASLSYDPDGTITSYIWNFGDESNQTETNEASVGHQYVVRGVYVANLTVIDNDGLSNSTTVGILVGRRPVPDFYPDPDLRDSNLNGTYGPQEYGPFGIYGQNDTIGFDASASKVGEEGAIDTYVALYVWDFGDYTDPVIVNTTDPSTFNGSQAFLASHNFVIGGGFNVNLTIYDNWGISAYLNKTIITSGEATPYAGANRNVYYAVAGAVFAVVVVGAIIMKKRQKPESARKERYRVI